jgi:hypothetical protein
MVIRERVDRVQGLHFVAMERSSDGLRLMLAAALSLRPTDGCDEHRSSPLETARLE